MSTMTLRSDAHGKFGGFGRLVTTVKLLAEAFAEARRLADEAHRKYPFVRW